MVNDNINVNFCNALGRSLRTVIVELLKMARADLEVEFDGSDPMGAGVGGAKGKVDLAMRLWVLYTFEQNENCGTRFEVEEFERLVVGRGEDVWHKYWIMKNFFDV